MASVLISLIAFCQSLLLSNALLLSNELAPLKEADAGLVFTKGPVANGPNETPKLTITVKWTKNTKVRTSTVVVSLAPGDNRKQVANKVKDALERKADIADCFTFERDSRIAGTYQVVEFFNKKNCFACSVSIMNGVFKGNPPKLADVVKGIGMSGGVSAFIGNIKFSLNGDPSSGVVGLAVNGVVATSTTGGQSLFQILADLDQQLRQAGLKSSLHNGEIFVQDVNPDNLDRLGPGGFLGGVSSEITDPGMGQSGTVSLPESGGSVKVLADSGSYAHNWIANHNNLDAGNGAYIYFFSNQTIGGGPPTLGDNVRKCWNSKTLTGGTYGTTPHAANWVCVVQGTNAAAGPHIGQVTVSSLADPQGGSDVCIAPFTVNPIWIVGGLSFAPGFLNLTPGFWVIGFQFIGGGPAMPAFGINNTNTCLEGRIVYELQHGYNGTVNNQQYLHLVSIDEIQYPIAGGISEGDSSYGRNEWGPVVGPGNVVSYSRFISFSGNAIYILGGQSIEGNGDGLELDLGIAFNIPAAAVGRDNGTTDCNAAPRMDFGAGGCDWVSCTTSGMPGNNISFRTVDYFYAQQGDPVSRGFNGTNHDTELFWSITDTMPCTPIVEGGSCSFNFGHRFDNVTNQFNTNGGARASFKFGSNMTGVSGFVFGALWVDGCWPSYCADGVTLGKSELPRGAAFLLNLCNSRAQNVVTSGRTFYVTALVRANSLVPMEISNTAKIPIH